MLGRNLVMFICSPSGKRDEISCRDSSVTTRYADTSANVMPSSAASSESPEASEGRRLVIEDIQELEPVPDCFETLGDRLPRTAR